MPLHVPPRMLKDKKALEAYVHKYVFPRVDKLTRMYLAKYFTVLFADGFESGDFTAWDSTSGSPTVQSSITHHGDYAMFVEGDNDGGSDLVTKGINFSGVDPRYLRFYIYFSDIGDTDYTGRLAGICYYGSFVGGVELAYSSFNRLRCVYNNNSGNMGSTEILQDTWYCVEIEQQSGSGTGYVKIYLNGVLETENTGLTLTTSPDNIRIGNYGDYKGADIVFDCVVIADTYIGPEEENVFIEVADTLGLSGSVLRHKPSIVVFEGVGSSDAVLGNKNPLVVADTVSFADLVEVITGAITKTVLDTIGTVDFVYVDKQIAVADTLSVLDTVFRHKPAVSVLDVVTATEAVLVSKLLSVSDSVNLADVLRVLKTLNVSDATSLVDAVSTPSRVLQALDAVSLVDDALVHKTLIITETVNLVEVIEVANGDKKTKLFLIIGDLAVQLTGD